MFIGHISLALAAKRATPRTPLIWLLVAAQFADMLWPVFLALGVETVRIDPGNTRFTPLDFVSYPWSHSLLMLSILGALLGIAYYVLTRDTKAFVIIALLVVSHWVLDWISHRPDMPLYPGGARHGLGLWNSIHLTIAGEGAMFAAGVWIYAATTKPTDQRGRWGLVALVVLLIIAYLGAAFGGAPPNVTAIWITALIGTALFSSLVVWLERHRAVSDFGV